MQSDTTALSVVIPTRNEAENVALLLHRLKQALSGVCAEILFVDDSPDQSTVYAIGVAQNVFEAQDFQIRIYHRPPEKQWGGLSGSVYDGLQLAQYDEVVVMDGDLQHPPEAIPALLNQAGTGTGLVVASRYCQGASARGLSGFIRTLVSRYSTWAAKLFFPSALRGVSDPMTGFFLVRRPAIDLTCLRPRGFKILLEILARHPGLRRKEVPFRFGSRVAGRSKGNFKRGLEYIWQLLSLRISSSLGHNAAFRSASTKAVASPNTERGRMARLLLFSFIGGSVFGIGFVTLWAMVEVLGWPATTANAAQLALTFFLNYWLNRHLTWRRRDIQKGAATRFTVSRGATGLLNYWLFAWLTAGSITISLLNISQTFTVHYLAANVFCVGLMTLINFVISDRWVFASPAKVRHVRSIWYYRIRFLLFITPVVIGIYYLAGPSNMVAALLVVGSLIMFVQAVIESWRMLYSYREPHAIDRMRFPKPQAPQERFCLLVPARHEAAVLGTTLRELARQTHPDVTITTVVCHDDIETLQVARDAALASDRIVVLEYIIPDGLMPSKPLQLNYAFEQLNSQDYTVVGVIDAEDTVHPDLLRHIDTAFRDTETQIVQGGIQLMNHDSKWFALHNVLEYWKWFSNVMKFQADQGFVPLGGNTVFVRYGLLKQAGGWPLSLTEDCALGVLLSTRYSAKTATYYDARLTTQEETPATLRGLFFQRVRWDQGFYAEWRKNLWRELPGLRKRFIALYILANPSFQTFSSLMIPITFYTVLQLKAPVGLVLLMYAPLIPLTLQLLLNVLYLHDFGKAFQRKIRVRDYINLFLTHFLYQAILNLAALWAMIRELRGNTTWYKTAHSGQHREQVYYTDQGLVPEEAPV